MSTFTNVYAVLVHEAPECVVDLVRNLAHLDPDASILVYDGGDDARFLPELGLEAYGAVLHPDPRPMRWGYLHDFALDCMRFALDAMPFDALTIVDSDQLALRGGYSKRLEQFLSAHPSAGLLGKVAHPQPRHSREAPALHAWRELELWRPYLERFELGLGKFPWWTFWPSTVFTRRGAEALVRRFDEDEALKDILRRSSLWATEEVLFPTLVALEGLDVLENPASYDLVRYRVPYTTHQLAAARRREDVFWVHPVPRRIDDPLRAYIRNAHQGYAMARRRLDMPNEPQEILRTLPLLEHVRGVEGWLEDDEADLLLATAEKALSHGPSGAVVEVGSYQGKATILLAAAVRAHDPERRVHAIDPHDGVIGARDRGLLRVGPTRAKLEQNLRVAGLEAFVEVVERRAPEVEWQAKVGLLLVDGLHDYESVSADFEHFAPHLEIGAYVAFHDCAEYFPGVVRLVRELEASGRFVRVARARSLVVLRRVEAQPSVEPDPASRPPRVSCIMPTRNRRAFVPEALAAFAAQDFEGGLELIVVDDGDDDVEDLVGDDPRIRYVRLEGRRSIGAKRNLACEMARGEIVVHLDDDDWQAPRRVRVQVEAIDSTGADVVGLKNVYYEDLERGRAFRYEYGEAGRPVVVGCSMAYRKAFWARGRFPEIDVGEDARFIWSRPGVRLVAHEDDGILVARMHAGNVSPKRTEDPRWRAIDPAEIDAVRGGAPLAQEDLRAGTIVSCVMPTRDRPELVMRAVLQFERQTLTDAELVVVDDGRTGLASRLAAHPRVRHVRAPTGSSVGAKRNLGTEAARGRFIAHWDDDDWYGPERLEAQVAALEAGDARLCGLRTRVLYDATSDRVWTIDDAVHRRMFVGDVHGRSLMFDAELWRSGVRYPATNLGEDATFLREALSRAAKLVKLDRADLLVYVRHAGATWRFECGSHVDPAGWSEGVAPPGFDVEERAWRARALSGREAS